MITVAATAAAIAALLAFLFAEPLAMALIGRRWPRLRTLAIAAVYAAALALAAAAAPHLTI